MLLFSEFPLFYHIVYEEIHSIPSYLSHRCARRDVGASAISSLWAYGINPERYHCAIRYDKVFQFGTNWKEL